MVFTLFLKRLSDFSLISGVDRASFRGVPFEFLKTAHDGAFAKLLFSFFGIHVISRGFIKSSEKLMLTPWEIVSQTH